MGHESDVSDLAWSHDQTYLASCGFDSKIVIWDASSFGNSRISLSYVEKIVRIDGHDAFVKGISWDPAGQFLAAQSDDKTCKIYRVSDWKIEKEISVPYQTATASTTFFRRLR